VEMFREIYDFLKKKVLVTFGSPHVHPRLMYQGMATIAEASAAVGVWAQYDFFMTLVLC